MFCLCQKKNQPSRQVYQHILEVMLVKSHLHVPFVVKSFAEKVLRIIRQFPVKRSSLSALFLAMYSVIVSTRNNHMRIHTGERQHECFVKGKEISRRALFTCHLRVHCGTEPYWRSTFCGKFNSSSNLSAHMRRHDGEKPCACHVRSKKFRRIGGYSILIGGTAPGSGVWYQDGGTVPQFEVPGYHSA